MLKTILIHFLILKLNLKDVKIFLNYNAANRKWILMILCTVSVILDRKSRFDDLGSSNPKFYDIFDILGNKIIIICRY